MRKLLIFFGIFTFSILAAQTIDERKTDIYFGNGVWNKQFSNDGCINDSAAECSKQKFNQLIKREVINNNPILQQKYGEVKLQYNWGKGPMDDVLETYYQLKEAGQINGIEFFALMTLLFNGDPIPAAITTAYYSLRESAIASDEQNNVVEMAENYYFESLQYSHRVLLVSHSQGNLFANRIAKDYAHLSGYDPYFANLQVASPASRVDASKGDYVTAFVDPIINPIPGSMTSNANIPWPGHSFVGAYLSNSDPLEKIITKTKTLLNALESTPSQWQIETNNESTNVCEERKARLVHFENAVTPINVAFPFNTQPSALDPERLAGKVYQVPEENNSTNMHYVMGSEVLSTYKTVWTTAVTNWKALLILSVLKTPAPI